MGGDLDGGPRGEGEWGGAPLGSKPLPWSLERESWPILSLSDPGSKANVLQPATVGRFRSESPTVCSHAPMISAPSVILLEECGDWRYCFYY